MGDFPQTAYEKAESAWEAATARAFDVDPTPFEPTTRAEGRPPGRFHADLDWNEAELLFVQGEIIDPPEGGPPLRKWLTFTEIAHRMGCTKQRVSAVGKQRNWQERKDKFRLDHASDIYVPPVNPAKRLKREPLRVLDDYLQLFEEAILTRRLRADAIGDFDKAVRLREFLIKEGHAKDAQKTAVSMDELQARHARARKREQAFDPLAAGVVPEGEASAAPTDYRTDAAPVDDAQPIESTSDVSVTGRPAKRASAREKRARTAAREKRRKAAGFKTGAQ